MTAIVLIIHLLLALSMILLILIQKSEGGGLGIGGGSGGGGMGGFMTGRSTANLLTRATAVIAALFMITSLGLALLADSGRDRGSILDEPASPTEQPAGPETPTLPTTPTPSNQ